MSRLVIIGGSDAGIMAGLRAREVNSGVEPLLIVADAYPNFSICGIPYFISGEVSDWRHLAHRTRVDLESAGLELRLNTEAKAIDPDKRSVTVIDQDGATEEVGYDSLVIGTGAVPIRPAIDGLDSLGPADGVHVPHTIGDTLALADTLSRSPGRAIIVGAGYIGLEMAEALRLRGIDVTIVEQLPQVLSTVDPNLAALVAAELEQHDVKVVTNTVITSVARNGDALIIGGHGTDDPGQTFHAATDVILVVIGVRPDTALARTAGVELGTRGAITVDRMMRTSVPDIWAAGDCVTTYHRVLETETYLPLGSTAHKQGRVAGENALGGFRLFAGSVGTQVVKVFDLVATRTGLREHEAIAHGLHPVSHRTVADDHKAYYPGATPIHITVTGEANTGRLLGAQMIGHRTSAVAKRIDTFATALHNGMRVDDISDLDLSYTPPLGIPYDAVQAASHAWVLAASRLTAA